MTRSLGGENKKAGMDATDAYVSSARDKIAHGLLVRRF
jgi:hypothetical protein